MTPPAEQRWPAGRRMTVVVRTGCCSCRSTHDVAFDLTPADRGEDGLATASAKARIISTLRATECACGLTLGEAADLHHRRQAGTLS